MSSREAVSSAQAPAAIGPYSQAIRCAGFVFLSGQIALDPSTGQMVGEGDVQRETEQVLANAKAVLEAAGASFGDVVKATIFLIDMGDFGAVNTIYGKAFEGITPPARSTIAVAGLPKGARVEIELTARIP